MLLWSAVGFDREAREVARQQLHNAIVPYSRNIRYESLNANRADELLILATFKDKRISPLVERFPDDITLLAIYVRGNDALNCHRRLGPSFSDYLEWSVKISGGNVPGAPSASTDIEEDLKNRPSPHDTANVLHFIVRGQKLEPQNTFWDWMEMAALLAAGRENELPRVLNNAARKSYWDDHVVAEMHASSSWNQRENSLFAPAAKTQSYSWIPLRHLSHLRNVVRALAQQVMGLRLQKRDDEALQLGLQAMRLARMVRLEANTPITSLVGTACERIILREARVPLGKRTRLPFPSPASALGKTSESLLFLANQRSSIAAREISSEWTRLNGWRMDSLTDLFGGLVSRSTLERVGWTTRVASYIMMALPFALAVWLVSGIIGKCWNIKSSVSSWWGSLGGGLLLTGFLAFDWVVRERALQENAPGSFCDVDCVVPEELLFPTRSFLEAHGLAWSGVTLLLGMFAFYLAFAPYRNRTARKHQAREIETQDLHPIGILWSGIKWIWRGQGRLWSFLAPILVLALALVPAVGLASSSDSNNFVLNFVALLLALTVWPAAVGVRQIAIFLRIRQRTNAPARFIGIWHTAVGNFISVALLILPLLLWGQSRFERDFNRQFAPIERGQMVAAIQKMRGIPMR
ncbi:hypothetical protein IAD21_03653 [Abditibacteriota bacterium]|nr:hypothetical protein IAD21_03653 [Abditibacteriota bacterium]